MVRFVERCLQKNVTVMAALSCTIVPFVGVSLFFGSLYERFERENDTAATSEGVKSE